MSPLKCAGRQWLLLLMIAIVYAAGFLTSSRSSLRSSAKPARLSVLESASPLVGADPNVDPFLLVRRARSSSVAPGPRAAPPASETQAARAAVPLTPIPPVAPRAAPVPKIAPPPRVADDFDFTKPGGILNNRYRIVKRIGGRAEGDALEAWDTALERQILAKCYKEGKSVEYSKERAALLRLLRAPAFNATYGPTLDIFEDHGRQCIMQPLLGRDLEVLLRDNRKPFPAETVSVILHQALEQLAAAHALHTRHGDVKSDNLVVAKRNQSELNGTFDMVLIDWGQSAVDVEPMVIDGWQYYRPHPPERVLQLPTSYPSDVWGLGIVAIHMLTASTQFPSILDSRESLDAYFNKLEAIAGCIPPYLVGKDWKHKSAEDLQVESYVRGRVASCPRSTEPNILAFLLNASPVAVERTPQLPQLSNLLETMLKINPLARITAADALGHPLFQTSVSELPL